MDDVERQNASAADSKNGVRCAIGAAWFCGVAACLWAIRDIGAQAANQN